jgi:GTPase
MEKAVLVTVDLSREKGWPPDERAAELKDLARSSGADVAEEIVCHRDKPTPDLFVGKGKFEEIRSVCADKKADVLIFNNELTPTQLRNMERGLGNGVKVIDRTQLILDIFSLRAHSMEGKVQVELAQLDYLLPRLGGRGIELSRLGGGIGTRGPGEKILEYDKRRIKQRISKLKVELKELERRRNDLRKKRKDAMLANVVFVGYTNAGKTTLLNRLTNAGKLTADKLFSTLDPVARNYVLPNNLRILFHDTVGFLYKLPHNLIESFKATLEEVGNADLIIEVLDASNPKVHDLDDAVYTVLKELKAEDKPVINALNKTDLVDNVNDLKRLRKTFNNSVPISALTGDGLDMLIEEISVVLSNFLMNVKIDIPNTRMDKLNLIYEHGTVYKREDRRNSVYVEALIPVKLKNLI